MHKEFNKHFATFNFDFEFAMKCITNKDARQELATKLNWPLQRIDASVFNWNRNMRLRKEFLYHIEAKIDAAIEITTHLQMQTILFGQSIKGADKINEQLGDKVDYISSAKGLEAGFDLPNLQLGITWSRTSKALRATQTLGRILRKVEGKTAYFIELYVPDTQDENWLKKSLVGQKNVLWLNSINQIYQIIQADKEKLL